MVAEVKPEQTAEISGELARGRFTEEMLQEMRSLIGTELRTEPCVNNEYATRLAIIGTAVIQLPCRSNGGAAAQPAEEIR